MLISYDTFNSCSAKRQKLYFLSWILKKLVKITVSWKYGWKFNIRVICVSFDNPFPCDMYIHLHTICLTGATELGTVTCHFAPNQRRFQWSISRWILLRRNNVFGKKFQVGLQFICAEFQIFSTLSKHDITVLVIISHGNRSLTSYSFWPFCTLIH